MERINTSELEFFSNFYKYICNIQNSPSNQVIAKEFMEYTKKNIDYLNNPALQVHIQRFVPVFYRMYIYLCPYENSLRKELRSTLLTIFSKLNIAFKSPYDTIIKTKETIFENYKYVSTILRIQIKEEKNKKDIPTRIYIFLTYALLNKEFFSTHSHKCNTLSLYRLCLKILKGSKCGDAVKKIAKEIHAYLKTNPRNINHISNLLS